MKFSNLDQSELVPVRTGPVRSGSVRTGPVRPGSVRPLPMCRYSLDIRTSFGLPLFVLVFIVTQLAAILMKGSGSQA